MAVTLTTSGSINTTIDDYGIAILSTTSSVNVGAISLVINVPNGVNVKNVKFPFANSSGSFNQLNGRLYVAGFDLVGTQINTNGVVLEITASGLLTGSFSLDTEYDWNNQFASSSAEAYENYSIRMPELLNPSAILSNQTGFTIGVNTRATNVGSFAGGIGTLASGTASHAAGINTTASGQAAFSIGIETDADGIASFAAGSGSWARGDSSVAMGIGTIASASAQVTIGHYNFPLNSPDHLFVVGGGTAAAPSNRGNLLEVYGGIGSTYKAVKIDVGNTFTQTGAPPAGFNVYGNSTFRGNITASLGSNIILNDDSLNFNATSSFIILDTDTLTGPSLDFNKLVINRFGINFETSNKSTSPGTKYLWTNNSNRLFYGSDAIILNGGNTLGGAMTIGTNDTNNLQLETGGTTRVFISSSGNVGIGTASPQRRLHIDASGSSNTFTPLILTSVDANNRVGIQFASSSIASGKTHSLIHRMNSSQAEWILGASVGETGLWQFQPRDDSNYMVAVAAPYNGGTARIYTGQSQSLLALGAGAANSHLVISSSGNVGIGTTTPTNTLNVNGTTFLQGGQTTVRGSGATSATTALRVENSAAAARLTILDDGTSAFNTSHLYISSSGRVAVGTITPQRLFDVVNPAGAGIAASFGATFANNNFSGISFGYVEQTNTSYRKSALVFERTETHGGSANASGK
jgi:hypothetical protein